MVKKLYTEANIQDIADAIRQKNGSSATYTVADMGDAVRAIPTGGGSADIVNGIIEYYKANSGTISANTFVEFINGSLADGFAVGNGTTVLSGGYNLFAVALDSERVFVAGRASSSTPYGVICTVSGTTITAGTAVQLSTATSLKGLAKLDSESVMCLTGNLYGVICTISGTTITVGTQVQVASSADSYYYPAAIALSATSVLVYYRLSSNLYGVICTISGTTITVGTATQLATDSAFTDTKPPAACALDSSTAFISYRISGTVYYGVICTISGTTITVGTPVQVGSYSNSYTGSAAIPLSSESLAFLYQSNHRLYGVICTVSGTTITAGTAVQLSTATNSNVNPAVGVIDANSLIVVYLSSRTAYCRICTISNTTITAGTATQLAGGSEVALAVMTAGLALILDVQNNAFYGVVAYGERAIQASQTKIEGLTKTQATTSTAADVWVLNN